MQKVIVPAISDVAMDVFVVWINMLEEDDAAAASSAAQMFADAGVSQFYDPHRRAGQAVAQSLGGAGKAAWDIYLFYPPESEWRDQPPLPADWVHQLSDSLWAGSEHYFTGPDLARQLKAILNRISRSRKAP